MQGSRIGGLPEGTLVPAVGFKVRLFSWAVTSFLVCTPRHSGQDADYGARGSSEMPANGHFPETRHQAGGGGGRVDAGLRRVVAQPGLDPLEPVDDLRELIGGDASGL